MSTKTNFAPLKANAFADETKVKEGNITSSPTFKSIAKAASSSADVQLVVRRISSHPVIFANSFSHFFANFHGEEKTFSRITSLM